MKKLALTVSILAISSLSAFAGDLPARVANANAYMDPVYNWTGFYTGVNLGQSWGRSRSTTSFNDLVSGTALSGANAKFALDGIVGGGQFGYNWQRNNWLLGVEADIQGTGQGGNGSAVCGGGPAASTTTTAAAVNGTCAIGHIGDTVPFNVAALPVTNSVSQNLEWFGTLRGRVGSTLTTPAILGYVTGGLAYGEVRTVSTVNGVNLVGPQGVNTPPTVVPFSGSVTNRSTRTGWTVGGGIEGVIGGNWTMKAEYLYVDLGTVSGSLLTASIAPGGVSVITRYSSDITDHIFRVGFNYKWGGG
jgi:outer membrane immunogenic protein